ncbi:hypothetical protein PVAP13_9KG196200 [Panicum virgatum]|uniref:EGF-like domain-containing protein n=1 Tax=Panicum virgatum TaxID=38727 RepID=A0A8T0NI41_PANVG|nr:hypothetical protein PVAP13_9KG196200 [Panicum virgatum]
MSALARSSTSTASEPEVRLLLLLTALVLVVASAAGASVCDTANCGRGTCAELPKLIPDVPNYACHCDPGCIAASIDRSIQSSSLLGTAADQQFANNPVCAAVSCGPGGACKAGDAPFSYSCECQPGYANLLNLSGLPCVKNCFFGQACSALGLAPAPAPAPGSPPPPAGSHDSSGPPPSGTKGNNSTAIIIDPFHMRDASRRSTLAQ